MQQLFNRDIYYYHSNIRMYTAIFGSLFSGICVKRVDKSTGREEVIQVPIRYGKGNAHEKLGDTQEGKRIRQVLPVISFEITSIKKNVSRKTVPYNRLASNINVDNYKNIQFNRVPHDIIYTLSIRTKTMDDMLQMYEQIQTTFDPQVAVKVIDSEELNIDNQDIIIKMLDENPTMVDNYEESLEDSRIIEWSMDFSLEGYLYKRSNKSPVVLSASIVAAFSFENGTAYYDMSEFNVIDEPQYQENIKDSTTDIINDIFYSVKEIPEI